MRSALTGLAAAALLLLPAAAALLLLPAAASGRGEFRLTDAIQIVLLPREVVALDGAAGTGPREPLELGERVHWHGSRGRVGVVLTDRRILAVTPESASWQESRYRIREAAPAGALLGERVALIVTATRAVGFDGGSGNLVEQSLGPGESVLAMDAAENVAVVVTDRRALGVSPFAGGFFEAELRAGERLEAVEATGDLASVRTSRRLLHFRAPTGLWSESPLPLR